MAAPKETKETAVAVIPDRTKLTALTGTLGEMIQAFDQIGANFAVLQLNGWDTAQKCKAACWLAHGAGMNPAVFMQNHYCLIVQGKLLVEPKWEFIVGVLQSRVPGFRWKVNIETDDCAEVWMADGKNEHTVRYDLADAKRQGLLGRGGNAWTAGNTREMCLKQAIKRCGRRLSSAALMDLPVDSGSFEVQGDGPAGSPTAAEAIGEAVAKATGAPIDVRFEEEPAETPVTPESDETVRAKLAGLVTRRFGNLSRDVMAEKVSSLYNGMMKEKTGTDPGMKFTKAHPIGPVEAAQLCAYLAAAEKPKNGEPPEEEVPPPEVAPAKERTVQDAWDELMTTVFRARKLFAPRKFIQEFPEGSSKYWFTDVQTFTQAGDEASVKIQVGPDIVAPIEKMEALNRILAAICDEKERGGR